MNEIIVTIAGKPAHAFVGGHGEPLLLSHGGWGGAAMHWSPVWDRLAERFRVIAPDMPGIGRTRQAALGSVGAYAQWVQALAEALGARSAWLVGNSFGASVACRMASDHPERCRGLVLVNGIPMPETPRFMRWLGERKLGRRALWWLEKKIVYSPAALKRAFVDPARAPAELREVLAAKAPPQVDAFVDILVNGDSHRRPSVAPLLLCGEDDRLPGTTSRAVRRLHASWPGSKLVFVPGAGHLPQVENPTAFVAALASFLTSSPLAGDALSAGSAS